MADNYLLFSEVLPRLTQEEETWIKQQLAVVCVFDGQEYERQEDWPAGRTEEHAQYLGCRVYRDLPQDELPYDGEVGFAWEIQENRDPDWGRHLWVYSEDTAELNLLAHFIQKYLRQFHPDRCWYATYAVICSKPRPGEFGGGCVFVTAQRIEWTSTQEVLDRHYEAFVAEQQAGAEKPPTATSSQPPALRDRVVISVRGGTVQDVFADNTGLSVWVLDWDTEGCSEGDTHLVSYREPDGKSVSAFLLPSTVESFEASDQVGQLLIGAGWKF